MKYKKYLKN